MYLWPGWLSMARGKRLSPGSFVSIFLPNRVLPKLVTTRLFSENILPFKFCKTMSFTFQQFILFERCLLFLIIFFSYTFLARSGIDNCWAQNYNKKYLKIKKPWDRNTCFLWNVLMGKYRIWKTNLKITSFLDFVILVRKTLVVALSYVKNSLKTVIPVNVNFFATCSMWTL